MGKRSKNKRKMAAMQSQPIQQKREGTTYLAVFGKTVLVVTVVTGGYVYYQCRDMTSDGIYLRAIGKLLSTEWGVSMGQYLLSKYRDSKKPEPQPSTWQKLTTYFYKEEHVQEAIEPVNYGLERQESFLDKVTGYLPTWGSSKPQVAKIDEDLSVDLNAEPVAENTALPTIHEQDELCRAESCARSHVGVSRTASVPEL